VDVPIYKFEIKFETVAWRLLPLSSPRQGVWDEKQCAIELGDTKKRPFFMIRSLFPAVHGAATASYKWRTK
jgi:hypothetical protein